METFEGIFTCMITMEYIALSNPLVFVNGIFYGENSSIFALLTASATFLLYLAAKSVLKYLKN